MSKKLTQLNRINHEFQIIPNSNNSLFLQGCEKVRVKI